MFDFVWTVLGLAWQLVLALLCCALAIPLLLLLKAAGEAFGIAFSGFLAPLFYVPKQLRSACIALMVIWLLWAHPLPFWLCVYAIAALPVHLVFILLTAERYRSLHAHAVSSVFLIYVLHLSFLQAGRWTDSLLFQLLLTSLIGSAPAYFLRSMQRAYTVYEKDQEQSGRDKHARRINCWLSEGKRVPPFCLYLRGFMLDDSLGPPLSDWAIDGGRFSSRKPIFATNSSAFFNELDRMTLDQLESVLLLSSRKLGALIALGRPGEGFGAGRVETDEASWQGTAARLMDQATVIFLIPVDRPGTIWEIEHLVSRGYLNKTVFIVPTMLVRKTHLWNSTREKLRNFISLPDCRNESGFFMRNPEGKFVFAAGHWDDVRGLLSAYRTRKSLMRLLRACSMRAT